MSQDQIIVVMFLLFLAAAFIFIAGWNLAVRKWRSSRATILKNLERLEDQVDVFNRERELDPQRGWTDIGSQYALVRMERTIADIRTEIDGRQEKHKNEQRG